MAAGGRSRRPPKTGGGDHTAVPGDRLRSEDGRVEMLLPDGIRSRSRRDLRDLKLRSRLIRLLEGRALLPSPSHPGGTAVSDRYAAGAVNPRPRRVPRSSHRRPGHASSNWPSSASRRRTPRVTGRCAREPAKRVGRVGGRRRSVCRSTRPVRCVRPLGLTHRAGSPWNQLRAVLPGELDISTAALRSGRRVEQSDAYGYVWYPTRGGRLAAVL